MGRRGWGWGQGLLNHVSPEPYSRPVQPHRPDPLQRPYLQGFQVDGPGLALSQPETTSQQGPFTHPCCHPLAEGPRCCFLQVKECGACGGGSFLPVSLARHPHPTGSAYPEPLPQLQLSHLEGLDLSPRRASVFSNRLNMNHATSREVNGPPKGQGGLAWGPRNWPRTP